MLFLFYYGLKYIYNFSAVSMSCIIPTRPSKTAVSVYILLFHQFIDFNSCVLNSNLIDIRYGTANLTYTNTSMLSCMLSFTRKVKAIAVTRHRVNDTFAAFYGASDIVIGAGILDDHYNGNGVQLRVYSCNKNFESDTVCPICYIAVLGD